MRKQVLIISLFFIPIFLLAQNNNCACCTDAHSEFDFWVGSWEVTNPDGSIAGNNTISKVQDNCVLKENWVSATLGYTGTSNNFFNLQTKQWEQIWVDNKGASLHLKGNRKGNQMILESDQLKNQKGEPIFHRVTWTKNKDGSVRQLWETITEKGNVTIAFNGLYKKKN